MRRNPLSKPSPQSIYGLLVLSTLVAIALAGATPSAVAQTKSLNITDGWRFRQIVPAATSPGTDAVAPKTPVSDWHPAKVPGDVHLDLLAQQIIPDPFWRNNEAALQWIGEATWEYQTEISLPSASLESRHIDLVFDGLDAYAKVYLNDTLILTAENQFRIWRIDAKPYLKTGSNSLRIVFPAQDKAALAIAQKDPDYPRNTVPLKSYVRKAAYEHGWDWGPTFVTAGIWKPVHLDFWNTARIRDFHVRQDDITEAGARLSGMLEIVSDHAANAKIELHATDSHGSAAFPNISRLFKLHAGVNTFLVPMEIDKPQRWFPAGYGSQPLYDFTASSDADGERDQKHTKAGLRSLELRRESDQWGRSFEFVINGIPVFAKGADVIPSDSFANRVTITKYREMLRSAKDANMNMVRVWGGGYYESDDFYDLCDELGIMVWQDFMFGNDWQPGTYDFEQNVEIEAGDQLRRLRDHTSIVLWSGNNETEIAFHWLDRDKLPSDVRLKMWQDYLTLFHGVLARSVARLDPEVPYWPSSPSADLEPTSSTFASGDEHVWDVWHGRVPFSTYETHHPRFVSEYGFQSFPDIRTIETFTTPEDRANIFTPVMLAHQKNNEGNALIHDYMLRDYSEPKDFDSFLYVSQVLQAEGIKIGAEHFRRDRPRTMGSIYWQLNDCWPVASWSSIDYTGRWKALQYYAKRFYAPVVVSPHVEDATLKVDVVSDRTEKRLGTLHLQQLRFDGKSLLDKTLSVDIPPLSSKTVYAVPLSELSSADKDLTQSYIVATLSVRDEPESRNILYLVPTKQITLPKAHVSLTTKTLPEGAVLEVHTDNLARSIELKSDDAATTFDDNFFDLLPGETRLIHLGTSPPSGQAQSVYHVRSLTDAFPEH